MAKTTKPRITKKKIKVAAAGNGVKSTRRKRPKTGKA